MAGRVWTCQRVTGGVKCGHENPRRVLICRACGKKRPPTRRPAHTDALELSYAEYIARQGYERCGICDRPPKPGKKLHRDHDHRDGGKPRGLLCFVCNAGLRYYMTADWLRAALAYVERWEEVA